MALSHISGSGNVAFSEGEKSVETSSFRTVADLTRFQKIVEVGDLDTDTRAHSISTRIDGAVNTFQRFDSAAD